jgi:hypothetical protein
MKIILVINLSKKIVKFLFYFDLEIVRFFYRTLYNCVFGGSNKDNKILHGAY